MGIVFDEVVGEVQPEVNQASSNEEPSAEQKPLQQVYQEFDALFRRREERARRLYAD